MNPEIKRRWVEALRSGNYKQGNGYLHQLGDDGKDEYCCLGVLCELAVQDEVIEPAHFEESSQLYYYDDNECFLPQSVITWAGLPEQSGDPLLPVEDTNLSELNDSKVSFRSIANLIEEEL